MIGVGKEDQAVKLPFVPYHTECKYGQVFTTGYNVPHHFSSFLSFPWETWHFSPFLYSCFPHQCRYTRGQPVGFPVLLTQHQWGLGKHHLTPVTGRYLSSCSVLIFITSYYSLLGGVLSVSFTESSWDVIVSSLLGWQS